MYFPTKYCACMLCLRLGKSCEKNEKNLYFSQNFPMIFLSSEGWSSKYCSIQLVFLEWPHDGGSWGNFQLCIKVMLAKKTSRPNVSSKRNLYISEYFHKKNIFEEKIVFENYKHWWLPAICVISARDPPRYLKNYCTSFICLTEKCSRFFLKIRNWSRDVTFEQKTSCVAVCIVRTVISDLPVYVVSLVRSSHVIT